MPSIRYVPKTFKPEVLEVIERCREICEDYTAQGYDLTLRQLYYQNVARGLIPNKDSEYKKLGSIINDARLAGLLDWDHIVDRTRHVRSNSHWNSPADIIESASASFQIDKWAGQTTRVEVWIEKDALVGVIEDVCERNDVSFFSCRGYTSQSEVWGAAQRMLRYAKKGQRTVVLHLGDHDPSGIDMTRDIQDRLDMFVEHHGAAGPTVRRIALTWDQIQQYNPPPNPAKITDSRATKYIAQFGAESWELDALEPQVISDLIDTEIDDIRDQWDYDSAVNEEQQMIETLKKAGNNWQKVEAYLKAL